MIIAVWSIIRNKFEEKFRNNKEEEPINRYSKDELDKCSEYKRGINDEDREWAKKYIPECYWFGKNMINFAYSSLILPRKEWWEKVVEVHKKAAELDAKADKLLEEIKKMKNLKEINKEVLESKRKELLELIEKYWETRKSEPECPYKLKEKLEIGESWFELKETK